MLEVKFYRHTTEEPLTKEFILNQMIYPKDILPNELKYNNSFNHHLNLVCKKNKDNNCVFKTQFGTALVTLLLIWLTEKAKAL